MAALVVQLLVAFWATSFFFSLPSVLAATTVTKPATPITTCCPPGHFLAIEDLQGSRQDPEGVWRAEPHDHRRAREGPLYDEAFTKSYLAKKAPDPLGDSTGQRLDRHLYISRVFCVPDKNDLPSIDGLSGSSLPSPPYFATKKDWKQGISVKIRVLAEDQVLRSKGLNIFLDICLSSTFSPGSRLPSCPGGPAELSTIVLGEGGLDTQRCFPLTSKSRPLKW